MAEIKHTSGPWSILIEGNNCFVESPEKWTIARVSHPFPFTTTDDERDANARLIAAAPDLLEALIAAEAALNKIRVCCMHTAWDATGPAVIAARAAISRATGEAS